MVYSQGHRVNVIEHFIDVLKKLITFLLLILEEPILMF